MGYIKAAPLCMYDCTRWVLGIIRGCHTSNNLHRAEKLKLPMVAPSQVRSSPHSLSAAPLPTIHGVETEECCRKEGVGLIHCR